ncbi:unnamed protein product [Didymodactylos carnosus]|uniref:Suppressor APC domain-containing protein n=1 Tax=Didymodactylos carnosus TaxID=1234261 RepID=A0A8S2I0Y3_9BILA|nr:unnamed protein product [Didymodactylos carnosus]CAF3686376.1 unnamed protein product [Didymodactylos carnosus]
MFCYFIEEEFFYISHLDRCTSMNGGQHNRLSTSTTTVINSPLTTKNPHDYSTDVGTSPRKRAPPPPPPKPPVTKPDYEYLYKIDPKQQQQQQQQTITTLPLTFVSSLKQLFSILDKTNTGRVNIDVFKKYWPPLTSTTTDDDTSEIPFDLLEQLEQESKLYNYQITFELLLAVIEKSLHTPKTSTKYTSSSTSSLSSLSPTTSVRQQSLNTTQPQPVKNNNISYRPPSFSFNSTASDISQRQQQHQNRYRLETDTVQQRDKEEQGLTLRKMKNDFLNDEDVEEEEEEENDNSNHSSNNQTLFSPRLIKNFNYNQVEKSSSTKQQQEQLQQQHIHVPKPLKIIRKDPNYFNQPSYVLGVLSHNLTIPIQNGKHSLQHHAPPISFQRNLKQSNGLPTTNPQQQPIKLPRSTSVTQDLSRDKTVGDQQQPKKNSFHVNPVYSSYNENMDQSMKNTSTNGIGYYGSSNQVEMRQRKKEILSQQTQTTPSMLSKHNGNSNLYTDAPSVLNHQVNGHISLPVRSLSDNRRNTIHCHEIDFSMIRAMKRFEIERDLLLQTCDTMERVKCFLTEKLIEMKEKQRYYCLKLSTSESTGIAPEPVYNRDLVADLLKLASTVLNEAQYDTKNVVKLKNDRINQLENEKRILIQELFELRNKMTKTK